MTVTVASLIEYNYVLSAIVCFLLLTLLWTIVLYILSYFRRSKLMTKIRGKHVLITGGSQGLGLNLACEMARLGATVTIMARNKKVLDDAAKTVKLCYNERSPLGATCIGVTADVTDIESLRNAIEIAEKEQGTVYVLFPCAGKAYTGYFHRNPMDEFRKSIDLNYFGVLHTVKLIIPSMVARGEGHVCFISSGLALTAFLGYTSYCPSKWAVRGLADCLRSELAPFPNVHIYQAFPPAMDTPGYELENASKPVETQRIEDGEDVYQADYIARAIVTAMLNGEYLISCGDFGLSMLTRSMAGMTPRYNLLLDMVLAPIIVIVGKVYVMMWDSIVRKNKTDETMQDVSTPTELLDDTHDHQKGNAKSPSLSSETLRLRKQSS